MTGLAFLAAVAGVLLFVVIPLASGPRRQKGRL